MRTINISFLIRRSSLFENCSLENDIVYTPAKLYCPIHNDVFSEISRLLPIIDVNKFDNETSDKRYIKFVNYFKRRISASTNYDLLTRREQYLLF